MSACLSLGVCGLVAASPHVCVLQAVPADAEPHRALIQRAVAAMLAHKLGILHEFRAPDRRPPAAAPALCGPGGRAVNLRPVPAERRRPAVLAGIVPGP